MPTDRRSGLRLVVGWMRVERGPIWNGVALPVSWLPKSPLDDMERPALPSGRPAVGGERRIGEIMP